MNIKNQLDLFKSEKINAEIDWSKLILSLEKELLTSTKHPINKKLKTK